MAETSREASKILVMGLDGSGKTSIILSLQQKTNLMSFFSLKPTQGLEIVKLKADEKTFAMFDFGGQDKFREYYLENFDKYIQEVDKLIYVIDVQDVERYELAIKYLESIIEALKNENIIVNLSIFLHKFDPNLEKLDQFSNENISKNIINKIEGIIPKDFKYNIYRTTIYTVFEKCFLL